MQYIFSICLHVERRAFNISNYCNSNFISMDFIAISIQNIFYFRNVFQTRYSFSAHALIRYFANSTSANSTSAKSTSFLGPVGNVIRHFSDFDKFWYKVYTFAPLNKRQNVRYHYFTFFVDKISSR